jgi:chemotaxis protein histidine kinase CheA
MQSNSDAVVSEIEVTMDFTIKYQPQVVGRLMTFNFDNIPKHIAGTCCDFSLVFECVDKYMASLVQDFSYADGEWKRWEALSDLEKKIYNSNIEVLKRQQDYFFAKAKRKKPDAHPPSQDVTPTKAPKKQQSSLQLPSSTAQIESPQKSCTEEYQPLPSTKQIAPPQQQSTKNQTSLQLLSSTTKKASPRQSSTEHASLQLPHSTAKIASPRQSSTDQASLQPLSSPVQIASPRQSSPEQASPQRLPSPVQEVFPKKSAGKSQLKKELKRLGKTTHLPGGKYKTRQKSRPRKK